MFDLRQWHEAVSLRRSSQGGIAATGQVPAPTVLDAYTYVTHEFNDIGNTWQALGYGDSSGGMVTSVAQEHLLGKAVFVAHYGRPK
jgi:hypothetical protein